MLEVWHMRVRSFSLWITALAALLWQCLFPSAALATGSVTLAWNANPESDIVSYTVHYGTVSGQYPQSVSAGNNTTVAVNGLTAGTWYFVVTALDANGLQSVPSTEISTAIDASDLPPTVTITVPQNGATYSEPADVTFTATAADSDGTVSHVDFYNGSTLLKSVAKSPYTFVWHAIPAGTYSVTAKAFDNLGASTVSAIVSITVNPTAAGLAGSYSGVTTVAGTSAARVSLTLSKTGHFTGKITNGIVSNSFSGVFDSSGTATVTIKPKGQAPYTLTLNEDVASGLLSLSGIPGDTDVLSLGKSPFNAKNITTNLAFTIVLGDPTPTPQANGAPVTTAAGFATGTITKTGAVRLTGVLGDLTPFTASSQLMGNGAFAIYALPYHGLNGYVAGTITLEDMPGTSDGDGTLTWIKPAQPKRTRYASGWQSTVPAQLSQFETLKSKVPGGESVYVSISGGGVITDPMQADLPLKSLVWNGFVYPMLTGSEKRLQITINRNTGLFTGKFRPSPTSALTALRGVLYQKTGMGVGYFVAPGGAGEVDLSQIPATITQ